MGEFKQINPISVILDKTKIKQFIIKGKEDVHLFINKHLKLEVLSNERNVLYEKK